MNATSRAGACPKSDEDTRRPSKSGSENAGNGVPSASIVDGVATMKRRSTGKGQYMQTQPRWSGEATACALTEGELELDGDQDRYGFAEARAGPEPPLFGGLYGLL